jgi:hypothetical protein
MLGIVGRVDAAFYSAGLILSDCESEVVGVQNVCTRYLAAIADATEIWATWGYISEQMCVPKQVSTGQLRKIYIKYANENPEGLHHAASGMAINAFHKAFPCE